MEANIRRNGGAKTTCILPLPPQKMFRQKLSLMLIFNQFYTFVTHNLYSSPSTIRMLKSRRMRWAGHVARMGERRNAYRILV
jgi:hypothetical protein